MDPKVSEISALYDIEQKIEALKQVMKERKWRNKLPSFLDKDLARARTKKFMLVDVPILIGGLIFYLLFTLTDIFLGGDAATYIVILRVLIVIMLALMMLIVPYSSYSKYMMDFALGGIFLAGLSVLFFSLHLPDIVRFSYHLGMIPIQVFIMVAFRLSMSRMVGVSFALFFSYVGMNYIFPMDTDNDEVDKLLQILVPFFLIFWFLLIIMGAYMGSIFEASYQRNFLQKRMMMLESDRLTILMNRLHVLSTTDSLTGINNRRYFEETFIKEWNRAWRDEQSIGLIMIDVDHFKKYNDHYGHQMGDDCLKRVSHTIASLCQRSGDFVARYGGEEFVVLLPGAETVDVMYFAETLRRGVEELKIEHEATERGVCTISLGAVALRPDDENSAQLLRLADNCLYLAKGKGRNCVVGIDTPIDL